MCVICVKPRGVDPPDEDTFEKMFKKNPDGAGFMWVQGGKVHVRKGFMEFDDFMDKWAGYQIQKSMLAVAHFRIGTSGGKTDAMTHPFPVSDEPDVLKLTSWDGDMALAHNGVFGQGSDDLSDTALFVKEIIHPIRSKIMDENGQFDPSMKPLLGEAVDTNRVVMINQNGSLISLGSWDKLDSGIYVSNKLWSYTSSNYTNSNYTTGGANYNSRNYSSYCGSQTTHNSGGSSSTKTKTKGKSKSSNNKSSTKTKSKSTATTEKMDKIRDDTDVYEIPGSVAIRLMKMGIVLKKKPNNNMSHSCFYRWDTDGNNFEIYWAGREEVQWRSSDVDISRMTFLFPDFTDDIDNIYATIESIDDYIAYPTFENILAPLTEFDSDNPEEMDIDLSETIRACRILEIRHQELDIQINELQNILYAAGQLTSDLMERRRYVEELADSVEAHKVEVHKDFYQYTGRVMVGKDTIKTLAEKIEGTRAPLLKSACDMLKFEPDKLCPGQIRKDLYDLGIRPCHRCLKWCEFDEEGETICKECKNE